MLRTSSLPLSERRVVRTYCSAVQRGEGRTSERDAMVNTDTDKGEMELGEKPVRVAVLLSTEASHALA